MPTCGYLYFLCDEKVGDQSHLKHQAHTIDGIIIGRSPTSNELLVYNPQNCQYYKLDSYCIGSYWLPGLVYPDMKYDSGLFCSLLHDDNPSFEEKYPSGICVERVDQATNILLADTVMDVPFPSSGSSDESTYNYMVLFDNGTTALISLSEMASINLAPLVQVSASDSQDSLLPPFLQLNSKITYEHEGQFHKGFLGKLDGVYQFITKSHTNKRKEDWSIALPNFSFSWVDMCVEGILLPGHVSHTFLCSPISPTASKFDPVASFVSGIDLHRNCPPTLLRALADSHPDCDVWLAS
jgi:hypothetical protein